MRICNIVYHFFTDIKCFDLLELQNKARNLFCYSDGNFDEFRSHLVGILAIYNVTEDRFVPICILTVNVIFTPDSLMMRLKVGNNRITLIFFTESSEVASSMPCRL